MAQEARLQFRHAFGIWARIGGGGNTALTRLMSALDSGHLPHLTGIRLQEMHSRDLGPTLLPMPDLEIMDLGICSRTVSLLFQNR